MHRLITAAIFTFASGAAVAQSCSTFGNAMTCSNGLSAYRYGNGALFGDMTVQPRRNVTPMYTDLGAGYVGNATIFSDGRSAYTYGSATVTSDGRTCYRYGTMLICSRPYQGPAPSYMR